MNRSQANILVEQALSAYQSKRFADAAASHAVRASDRGMRRRLNAERAASLKNGDKVSLYRLGGELS
jgi:hypothetical protein